jgi:hypothetical protein
LRKEKSLLPSSETAQQFFVVFSAQKQRRFLRVRLVAEPGLIPTIQFDADTQGDIPDAHNRGALMTNRREFLHLGVAALGLPIAARAGVLPEGPPGNKEADVDCLPLYKVFFDERFAACRAFGDEMTRRGSVAESISGDITEAWYRDLYYEWQKRPAPIAGMTVPGTILCLEMIARDANMRVRLRVDHREHRHGRIEHDFYGPHEALVRAADFETAADQWPVRIAELISRVPAVLGVSERARFSGVVRHRGNYPEHLVSWVIASAPRG